ncbi:hypothetical protein PybrP1_004650 [[Pythium] brassicae (nom. inval.)]|nr:hypothetical protein PybrP1_004650 [[Pythium] brassicae (nom. inval.)]
MAQNPLTAFIGSFMVSARTVDNDAVEHLAQTADGAQWRLEDDLPAHRPQGFHQRDQYSSPEGFPEVPRQYIVPSHSKDQDFATYAANSYSSAIAIQELLKKRGF